MSPEKRSDEESRSMQEASVCSKNEMLHFVQHDKFLRTVIPALFHGLVKSQMGALG
jgi:hypothetical protein